MNSPRFRVLGSDGASASWAAPPPHALDDFSIVVPPAWCDHHEIEVRLRIVATEAEARTISPLVRALEGTGTWLAIVTIRRPGRAG